LHHRSNSSRTRVSHRRFPARPGYRLPLPLGPRKVLEVSKPACHHLVLLTKELPPLSTVSLITLLKVEAEKFL